MRIGFRSSSSSKISGMNPYVGRIHIHENCYVAQDSDPVFIRRVPQLLPLQSECELQHSLDGNCALMIRFGLRQCLRFAPPQRFRPFSPRAGVELAAQNSVKRIVVEPRSLIAAKRLKIGPLI